METFQDIYAGYRVSKIVLRKNIFFDFEAFQLQNLPTSQKIEKIEILKEKNFFFLDSQISYPKVGTIKICFKTICLDPKECI